MFAFRSVAGRAAMLLGLCGFWLGLAIASWEFPGEYDWRYMTVSNLFSAKHNPAGHWWGAAGLIFCGGAGICWVALGLRQPPAPGWGPRLRESWLLAVGFPCMVLAAALPSEWLVPKGHDWLAVIAFLTLCSGIVRAWVQATLQRYKVPITYRSACVFALACAVLWPVAGAALTQAYLTLNRPDLPWVSLAWRARQIPLYLSFALWEWLTCLVLSGCLAIICVAPPKRAKQQDPRGAH
jgi:hypothetical protein